MVTISSKITIGDYTFAGVVDLAISSSWDMLTDRCEMSIPSKVLHNGLFVDFANERLVKRGDKVEVLLGYDGNLTKRFSGYVVAVKAGSPVRILCEDEMFVLKKEPVTVSYESVTLKQLLTDILPSEIKFKAVDISLGQFRITDATPAQALEELKKTYHLHSWFRDGVLYSGLAYWNLDSEPKRFKFQYNIISDDLEYRTQDDIKIKVKAVSMLPDNSKIETTVGDADGELRTLHFYNITSETELKKIATEQINTLRYEGWFGSFETFGEPQVKHGDFVELIDERFDRVGTYLVKKVEPKGMRGLRQIVYLDRKV